MIPQLAAQKKRSRIALKGLRRAEIQSGVANATQKLKFSEWKGIVYSRKFLEIDMLEVFFQYR